MREIGTLVCRATAIIFGNTQSLNFGAILTYYALYKVLEKTGYNVALANKPLEEDVTNHSIVFYKKYTNLAPSEKQNEKYNLMTDIFLLGSDQLWNYPLFKNLGYYLNFANPDKKKITYATSFGFDYLTMLDKTQSIYPDVNSLMKRFDAISVREEDGINICDREHSVDATWVLDSVFLLEGQDYDLIAKNAGRKIKYKYLVSYSISGVGVKEKNFNKLLLYVSNYLGLPTVNMLSGTPRIFEKQRKNTNGFVCEGLSVEEWLYNIQNSEFVVTDSFHCTCFSIIFRKKFVVVQKSWGLSRLTSLLHMLGLEDRLIGSFEEIKGKEDILDREIDYNKVYRVLNVKRAESYIWLMNSLKEPKRVSEHLYLDRKDMRLPAIALGEITRLVDYLEKLGEMTDGYVLIACAHGTDFDRDHARLIIRHCMDYLHISEAEYRKTVEVNDNLLSNDSVLAKGNGKGNCRTLMLQLKECNLEDFRKNPHSVYSVSFDWQVDSVQTASEGSFQIQLGGAPWDEITEEIKVSEQALGGHYENIYMSSESIAKFETGMIQVRTDGLDCNVRIENFKLEKGNRPTARYSSQGSINGLALICDAANRHLDLSVTSLGRLRYQLGSADILLEYANQGYRNHKPVSELYINTARRDIYPMQTEGLFMMLYEKENQRLVDFLRVADDNCGSLTHI